MALLIIENKVDFPKISYLTASDLYLIICFGFILSSIIEFALVHYETRLIYEQDLFILYRLISLNKRVEKQFHFKKKMSFAIDSAVSHVKHKTNKNYYKTRYKMNELSLMKNLKEMRRMKSEAMQKWELDSDDVQSDSDDGHSVLFSTSSESSSERSFNFFKLGQRLRSLGSFLNRVKTNIINFITLKVFNKANHDSSTFRCKIYNRVSKIDILARILYPTTFIVFNIGYWYYYI